VSTIWSSLLGVLITKDGLSLSIVHRRFFMAAIGLNFAGTRGVRNDAWSTKSTSHVTKFFVTSDAWMVGRAFHACSLTQEGLAAMGGAMVERGDRSSIHVGSHRKAYQVRNDFLFCVVPELSYSISFCLSSLIAGFPISIINVVKATHLGEDLDWGGYNKKLCSENFLFQKMYFDITIANNTIK